MWNLVVEQFNNYAGTGLMMLYYLAAIIFLLVTEKRKEIRLTLVYLPLCVLFIYFNPWIANIIVNYADEDIYYRIIWLVPVSITVVYAMISLVLKLKGKLRIIGFIVAAFLLMVGGRLVYTDKDFSVAENEYHIPQEVVDICDEIVIPGREVMAAFPSDMLIYVRQYTAFIRMPYGWDEIKENPGFPITRLRYLIDLEEAVPAEELSREAMNCSCHYIIVDEKKEILGDMSEYGFEKYIVVDGYVIYKNMLADYSVATE